MPDSVQAYVTRTPDGVSLIARYLHILAAPGQLVLDRCFSGLVYGPRYHGRSRITLSQAIELAQAVAVRDGALVHLTGPPAVIHSRLLTRDDHSAEVGEAFTAWRKHLPDLGEELADIAIYTMALAEMAGLDLDSEVERKITKNHTRIYARDPRGVPVRVHEAALTRI